MQRIFIIVFATLFCSPLEGGEIARENTAATETYRLRRLDVHGNSVLDEDLIVRLVEYTPDRIIRLNPEALRKSKRKLLDEYAARGYREAQCTLSIETTDEPGGVALVIDVEEGRPERYTQIHFHGLPLALTPESAQSAAKIKKGALCDREKVEEAGERLVEHLSEIGYLDAETGPFAERRLDRYSFELTIPVETGLHTTVLLVGNRHFRTRELIETMKGKELLRTTAESLQRGLKRIHQLYEDAGFFFSRIQIQKECSLGKNRILKMGVVDGCPSETVQQRLVITINEGPVFEIAKIRFQGNVAFTNLELEQELFAFVREKIEKDDLFQPFTTNTVDDLGIADKRPNEMAATRGTKAPRSERSRIYVPELYADGMEHLVGVYREQGFLSAAVRDTCDLGLQPQVTFRNKPFVPLAVSRKTEKDSNEEIQRMSPCVHYNAAQRQLVVTVTVDEGTQTKLSEIVFEGNTTISSLELQKIAELSIGEPYNAYRLREAASTLTRLYKENGYMFVGITWEQLFSEDMKRARIVFNVAEGPKVRVRKIRIQGAEITSKRLIRERLTLETGDIITPKQLEKSQGRLMELGILDGATVQMVLPHIPGEEKNLVVQVTEGKPQYLELRGGIASVEGLRGGFEYGYRNLAGWAINARLRARANYRLFFAGNSEFQERYKEDVLGEKGIEHHVLVGLGSPHLPGTKGILGWGVETIKELLADPFFTADRLTSFIRLNTTFALGEKYPRGLLIETRNGIEYNLGIVPAVNAPTDDSLSPILRRYLDLPKGASAFWVTGLNITLDFRDHPFVPRRGIYFSIGGDWVRSLDFVGEDDWHPGEPEPVEETSNLIRAKASTAAYVPLFGSDLVLSISFTAGYIFHLQEDSVTWADRYFYVGGVETLRGFPQDSLLPEDVYQTWKSGLGKYSDDVNELLNLRGGQTMFLARAELRYPLAAGFYGAGFGEFGNLWRDQDQMKLLTLVPFKFLLRPVAGLGLRYMTPLGPVSLDIGANLNRRPHEDPFAWFFSIGTAF